MPDPAWAWFHGPYMNFTGAVAQLLAAFPQDPERLASRHVAGDIARAWVRAVRENPQTWTPVLRTGPHTPAPRRHRWTAHAVVAAAEHFARLVLTDPGAITDDELATLFDDLVNGLLHRR